MSEKVGFVSVLPADGEAWAIPGVSQVSECTRQSVDEEVRCIVDEAHDEATRLLTEHRDRLDALADVLIRKETLDEAEAYAAAGVEPPPESEPGQEEPEPVRSGAILTT